MEASKIAMNLVKSATESAKRLSELTQVLSTHNVRNIGIGLEELGVEEFVAEKYFTGELFVDTDKKSYQDLGFKQYSCLSVLGAVLSKSSRDNMSEAKKLGGNLKGDGYQNGGSLVVDQGGKTLYFYKQENVAEHASLTDILNSLGIDPSELKLTEAKDAALKMECNEDVCTRK